MDKYMEIEFQLDGTIKQEGFGFVGATCDEPMRIMQEALGEITSTERKPEYFEAELTGQHLNLCG